MALNFMRSLLLFAWLPFSASAQIVIAQVSPLSGPLGANGNANLIGAKAAFEQVNAAGGIHGAKIRFVAEDDQYKPLETIRLLGAVAARERPVLFVNLLGSAGITAIIEDQTFERIRIPVVGVTPGADSLRKPGSSWMFHVHAGDNAQLRRVLSHLSTIGINRIAVAYQDIPFGRGGLQFVRQIAPELKVGIVGEVPVPSAAEDLKTVAAALTKTGAQAYLMILVPNSGASLVRDLRAQKDMTPLYGMSYVPAKGIVEKAGTAAAVGVALAQVTPNPRSFNSGLTRDFHAAMDRHAPTGTDHSQLHLIGYLAGRVAIQALQKAGPSPSVEKVTAALRSLKADFGGYHLDFAGGNVGSRYVDIGVLDATGRLIY